MVPLALVAKLATRWRHLHELQIWPQDGTTCISCNIDHQMAPLALVANLPTRWRYLHCFQSWPPDCISCIATLLYWHYQIILSLYLHQLESHQLSWTKHILVSQWERSEPIRWDPRDTSVRWKSSQGEKNLKAVILWNVFSFTYYKHSTFVGISTYTQFQDNISQLPMYERKKTCKTNFKFSNARY